MAITMGEKIKIIANRRGVTLAQLAEMTNQSRQNMSNKMKRDNFSEKELQEIGEVLNCDFIGKFRMRDTGEEI
ncbi:MAG: helix-turn-helix transcriptional regulator [Candidatus Gastranaerophilales bacterium]|nr:helix-turn-helix transcriptional regulator [Candidatus Gastranaerophilales bacterium]